MIHDDASSSSSFFPPAAHLTANETWTHGPEYTFQVQVNCTAISDEGVYGSVRLNLESKLICQPLKTGHSLSCHFEDSKANSFVADSLDPQEPATPNGEVNRQPAYEINEDQFEIKFNKRGLDDLVVNENIQPRELDMIRMIVGQLSVGTTLDGVGNDVTFDAIENFTQGECYTTFKIDKKLVGRSLYAKPGYVLRPVFGLKDGKLMQIRKIRNLRMCAHKVPYFFGSAETFREESDIISDVVRINYVAIFFLQYIITKNCAVWKLAHCLLTISISLISNVTYMYVYVCVCVCVPTLLCFLRKIGEFTFLKNSNSHKK